MPLAKSSIISKPTDCMQKPARSLRQLAISDVFIILADMYPICTVVERIVCRVKDDLVSTGEMTSRCMDSKLQEPGVKQCRNMTISSYCSCVEEDA